MGPVRRRTARKPPSLVRRDKHLSLHSHWPRFDPRDAMLAPVLYIALCLRVSVSVTIGVLSKRMNESGWFLGCELLSTDTTLCYK